MGTEIVNTGVEITNTGLEMTMIFVMRLAIAGFLGALVGIDRERRAKDAGLRTHFLVSLGSCLIMIISQFGFDSRIGVHNMSIDPTRLASLVVSGIGFLCAGTIMMHKQFVRGLTTAAGLWVVAGIGLAVGAGLYWIAVATTLLVLIALELLYLFSKKFHPIATHVIFTTSNQESLITVTNELNKNNYHILDFTVERPSNDQKHYRVHMYIRCMTYHDENQLVSFFNQIDDVVVEKIEL